MRCASFSSVKIPSQWWLRRSFSSSAQKKKVSGLTVPGTLNIPERVMELRSRKLHLDERNPIGIIKRHIEGYFSSEYPSVFSLEDSLSEVVTATQNFSDLLIPDSHTSRALSDTYYFDRDTLLRPQTSAHQTEMIRGGAMAFLVSGDCYRKDSIDETHYPVFHQMEGVRIWSDGSKDKAAVESELKCSLEGLVQHLFPGRPFRWAQDYFPFTDPSFEMEVSLGLENGTAEKWLEIFGSGVIHDDILQKKCGLPASAVGWAFGLGLERLAMPLFGIYDIRQFWSKDERFVSQFADGQIRQFVPYSKFPICYKDVSFWLPQKNDDFHENDFMDLVRAVAGDIVESVQLIDEFTRPKDARTSRCYRICYRHNDRTLTNEETNDIQSRVCDAVQNECRVEIRG